MQCEILQTNHWFRSLKVFLAIMFISSVAMAQSVTVTGTVSSATDNSPLPGVSVVVKGTTNGVTTTASGTYSIKAEAGSTLVFTYIGSKTQEVPVAGKTQVNVLLEETSSSLNEVVVTALGIESKSSRLSYATQEVAGKDLNNVPQTNFMNNLSGRVAGATISRSASGLGGSVKVLLRGNKSAQGSNEPLYVINGVPMQNVIMGSTNQSFNSTDGGDGISNLNPDDIESMSVLKGPSAAALYGSQAANGAILITTKKGKNGVTKVDFASSFTADKAAYFPELQNDYGQTAAGSQESWGDKINNATDNISGFFKTGTTWTNSIAFSSGTDKMNTYVSYANTTASGIIPNNKLSRHNFNIRQGAKFFDDKLTVDASLTLVNQSVQNPANSGFHNTPVYGLYTFPRGLDFEPYKQYTKFDPIRNVDTQNWPFTPGSTQNPYWFVNKITTTNQRDRTLFNLALKYNINDWLNFQVRGNMDKTVDNNNTKSYLGSALGYSGPNGGYSVLELTNRQYYADALLSMNKTFSKLNVNAVLGSSITDYQAHGISAASTSLYIANKFMIENFDISDGLSRVYTIQPGHSQLQGVFGSLNLTYNDWLSLSATGRNDWSSNLSFTPNGSYFYPSVGLSALLHEAVKLPELISYAKLRGSYAVVGNSVPYGVTRPLNGINNRGEVIFNTTAPFNDLNPEKTKSLEFGTELRFLNDQISLDVTLYKTNTINQYFEILVPAGTGYTTRYINGGDIQNKGIEIIAGFNTPANKAFKWNTSVNFAANRNVVKKLATDIDQFPLTVDLNSYGSILKVGGSYGDMFGQVLDYDAQGRLLVNDDGTPKVKGGGLYYVGNPNPKFQLGWSNSFNYKNFTLSFLIDGKFGGKVMSLTNQILDGVGVSKASGDARNNGGVTVNGVYASSGEAVTKLDADKYYHAVGGLQHVTGEYVYDATVVRVREVSLGYTLPGTVLKKGFVKSARLSLIGRNLIYLYRKAPFDPETIFANGNGFSGLDIMSLPATRSFG
ncbi:MAG: SusC/RagA family TonB-linked outer membrane protein, partial [Sphingobacteriaceae bacterium]